MKNKAEAGISIAPETARLKSREIKKETNNNFIRISRHENGVKPKDTEMDEPNNEELKDIETEEEFDLDMIYRLYLICCTYSILF